MKKIFLLLIISVCSLMASAATKYQINVGGTEVTSDNYSYIGPASNNDITGGYAVYNSSTNTLTLYSITISRSTSGDYALHNRGCTNLKVVFEGTCNLTSTKARAIRCDDNTSLTASSGSTVNVTGQDDGAIYVHNESDLDIIGPGTFNIKSTSKKGAIQGDAKAVGYDNMDCVYFKNNVKATISSPESPLYNLYWVDFYECNVVLKATGNSSYPVVRDVGDMSFYGTPQAAILAPYGAHYDSSAKSIVSSSGSKIYNQDITISNDYVALFTSDYFPDGNFRTALLNLYPKGYITTSDVNNCTSLDVSSKSIFNLTGVKYFSRLSTLKCTNNYLSALPELPKTLTELNCGGNQISTLDLSAQTQLKNLNATSNTLSSITLPSTIETLNISYNKNFSTFTRVNNSSLKSLDVSNCYGLTTLSVYNNSAMTSLTASNCGSLTSLNCYNGALTSLNVNGCTHLTTLNCYSNALSSLNLNSCTELKSLDCHSNQITSLGTLPNSLQTIDYSSNKLSGTISLTNRSALKTLMLNNNTGITRVDCYYNALTTLGVTGCTALTYIDCHNNQLFSFSIPSSVQTLDCSNNKFSDYFTLNYHSALKSLNVSNNPGIIGLYCNDNALTSLNISGCSAMRLLLCNNNQLTSLTNLPTTLTTLDCTNNKLSTLSVQGCNSLIYIYCSQNQIKGSGMSTLVNSLRTIPEGSTGTLYVISGDNEGNVITASQVNTARNKRWIPRQYTNGSWTEIVAGDVNGDGKVNVSDVTALVNMILGVIPKDFTRGDINGDGKINVSDVTALVNLILGVQ